MSEEASRPGSRPAPGETPLLRVSRLSYHYPNGHAALCDVSFAVRMHEIVGLVGPNGAGKTTLLLHLNGLLLGKPPERSPASPTARSSSNGAVTMTARPPSFATEPLAPVEILGLPVTPPHLTEIRRQVGFLFQDPDDQLFCPTVREDVAFGPLNLGLPAEEVKRRVTTHLSAVGLAGFEQRRPQELSLGERRRVCLAGVLACEPSLLALDEPSSNLDPRSRRQFIQLLRDCPAAQIVASHDLEMILELCHRVILLDHGRIQIDGPPREILADEKLMHTHGLEVPLSLRYGQQSH